MDISGDVGAWAALPFIPDQSPSAALSMESGFKAKREPIDLQG